MLEPKHDGRYSVLRKEYWDISVLSVTYTPSLAVSTFSILLSAFSYADTRNIS
jgi:hypothetical protein